MSRRPPRLPAVAIVVAIALAGVAGHLALRGDAPADPPLAPRSGAPATPEKGAPRRAAAAGSAASAGGAPSPTQRDRVGGPPRPGRLLVRPRYALSMDLQSRALALAAVGDGAVVPLAWTLGADGRAELSAELAPGVWRLRVRYGPGDPPDARWSPGWQVEPPDTVRVGSGWRAVHTALIARAGPRRDPGTGTVRGVARLDGVPAAGQVVRVAPAPGPALTRVGADGSFTIDAAPGGRRQIELLRRDGDGADHHTGLVLCTEPLSVPAGGGVDVLLEARTGRVEGRVLHSDGRPAGGVDVAVHNPFARAVLLQGGSPAPSTFRTRTDARGTFAVGELPFGRWQIRVGARRETALLDDHKPSRFLTLQLPDEVPSERR